jgi:NAD(P)-dependent dehydrogenase (short-subunit alcohol dehydrogenase family)
MGTFINLMGESYSRLTALSRAPNQEKHTMWRALCECGNIITVRAQHLRNGNTKSCGCLDRETSLARSAKHGQYGRPVYESWKGMIQRCTNPANQEWKNYGGRGVTVIPDWLLFANFYKDMGDRPEGKTLDRENNELGYSKSNCKWSTSKEQAMNKRNTKKGG